MIEDREGTNTADQSFTYDHRNRLLTAVGQNYGTLNYSYTGSIGNIGSKEGVTYTYSNVNAGPHAVTSLSDGTTLTYDLNGNMSSMVKTGDNKVFTYDVENRLIDVKKNGITVAQYFYDGDGGRTRKINYASAVAGNNTCFLAGTKITMADGTTKSIEDIKVGEQVSSYDEKRMTKVSAKVTEMFDGERSKEYLLVNGSLKVTPNHKFFSQGKWVEIGKLKEGDLLFDENGEEIAIEKIEKVETQNSIQVYNLEVEGEHNYYADGLLVHNKLSYNPPAVSGVPVTSGVITNYIGSLAEETKGTWVNHVFLGSTKIATVSNSEARYYFQDHLGSANVVTNSTGSVIELIEYKPFGDFSRRNQFGTSNAAWYYFTGKPLDDETGLMFYGARYYSPLLGRFITPDSIVQAPMNPQTLNRYSYCNNNPVNLVDPDGHSWISKIFKSINNFLKDAFSDIERGLEKVTNSQWTFDVNIEVGQKHQVDNVGEVGFDLLTQPWQVGIGVLRWAHEPRFKVLKVSADGRGGYSIRNSAIEDRDSIFVNGILNSVVYAARNALKVGAQKIAYNPTDGALADLTESVLQKLFFTSSFDRQLAQAISGHVGIRLTGHSQGAIIVANTLLNLGLRGQGGGVDKVVYRNTQISQFRGYLSAIVGGRHTVETVYGSRYFDFSNALGPNLNPIKFLSGVIGLAYLPLGMDHHGLE